MIRTVDNLVAAAKMYPLWTRLAYTDLQQFYRRSFVGIAWITFSFAIFIFVKILIFGQISSANAELFACWLAIGYWVWMFISDNVMNGCSGFIHARAWILGTKLPLTVFLYQSLTRTLINFVLTSFIVMAAVFAMRWKFDPIWFWSLPGLLMLTINGMWVHLLFATLCTRFRDIIHFCQALMKVMFFLTPILYMPEQLGEYAYLLNYNPFTHYVAIIRDPIVLYTFPTLSWIVVLSITFIGWLSALLLFNAWGRRVPFWV